MALHVCKLKLLPSPGVPPCLSPIVMLLLCFLLSCSLLKPCTGTSFDKVPGFLHLNSGPNLCSAWDKVSGNLRSYIDTYYPQTDPDDPGYFSTFYSMPINGSSFSIRLTMASLHQSYNELKPYSSLMVFIQPALDPKLYEFYPFSLFDTYAIYELSDTSVVVNVSGSGANVSTRIFEAQRGVWVQIGIQELPPASAGDSNTTSSSSPVAKSYSVWIDYVQGENSVWVYVGTGEDEAATTTSRKPANAAANATLSSPCVMPEAASLGFRSSVGQLEQLQTLDTMIDYNDTAAMNSTMGNNTWDSSEADSLQPWCHPAEIYVPRDSSEEEKKKIAVVVSSVLGSAAATAISAAAAFLYFKSKQRRWKKEQQKLTKIMHALPGVPTQFDFADIKKATKNFHETMKLGRGGFGAVYRCTLPATATATPFASGTGQQAMEVAVKKFMQGVEDRRYNDFLAEVSIINRLRHKNIVPLVGWSYNKGEPLLIYEYMTNGSLDQHLFERGAAKKRQQRLQQEHPQPENSDIFQWDTRYNIVRDIATGLHYVHNEHEPMVLHRDIKASNIMLDSNFRARLGDFGIACTVAVDRTSATGIAGTFGYMAPEYVITFKATRQTDIYAFGVLVLEIVTGHKNGDVPDGESHITLWVRRLHREGKLLEAVDGSLVFPSGGGDQSAPAEKVDEAKRLLLLGLACTDPNLSGRPATAEVVQVINKLKPPPSLSLETPAMLFGLPEPEEWPCSVDSDCDATVTTTTQSSTTASMVELQVIQIQEQPMPGGNGGRSSVYR